MKIILTNDDGYGAPGLEALVQYFSASCDVVVVAPKEPLSGVSHRVTAHKPIVTQKMGPGRFSIAGTPADCARIALKCLAPDADWLVAGINPGANLGCDVYNSGTVAAAREAAFLGYRAIAVSQYIARNHVIDWELTGKHAGHTLNFLMSKALAPGSFWNVNLPHPLSAGEDPQYAFCAVDTHPYQFEYQVCEENYQYKGSIHERPYSPDTDVDHCFSGKVSITPLVLKTSAI